MDKHYKDYIQIGLNIMRYRKEQGLTQDQLSEMAGYSRNHLQRVENAVCKPTVGLLLDCLLYTSHSCRSRMCQPEHPLL